MRSEYEISSGHETKPIRDVGVNRNLERLQIPKFDGDKSKFEYFWAAFSAIVDDTDELPKYKMLKLKACLEGKAEEAIARLGFSGDAYEEAKITLKRKFGGNRRQIQAHLEDLRNMSPFQEEDVQDVEKFTENLVHTIVMLKEQSLWNELEPNSMLYLLLIEKIPESMLASYFRWSADKRKKETLEMLSEWMVEEAEYRVRALETKEGMETSNKKKFRDRKPQRSFTAIKGRSDRSCACCDKFGHGVWSCDKFKRESVRQRWILAKEKQLCFRCLSNRHQGKDCPRTQSCGLDGCKNNHHRLLHEPVGDQKGKDDYKAEDKASQSQSGRSLKPVTDSENENVSLLEPQIGAEKGTYITTLASAGTADEVVSFRTVPVWLKANGQKI